MMKSTVWHFAITALVATSVSAAPVQVWVVGRVGSDVGIGGKFLRHRVSTVSSAAVGVALANPRALLGSQYRNHDHHDTSTQ